MSKRRTEREIDEMSEAALPELSPDERLRLRLIADSERNERWRTRLAETCPRYTYSMTDLAFVDRGRVAGRLCLVAIYELHITLLHRYRLREETRAQMALEGLRDDSPTEAQLERGKKRGEEIQEVFTDLFGFYHGYRRFAEEILGVDIETWFASHPNGTAVLEAVEEEVDDPLAIELAEAHYAGDLEMDENEDEPEESFLEKYAEMWFEATKSSWEGAVSAGG